MIEQSIVTTPGPIVAPENLPAADRSPGTTSHSLSISTTIVPCRRSQPSSSRASSVLTSIVCSSDTAAASRRHRHCGLSRRSMRQKLARRYQIDKPDFKPAFRDESDSRWPETEIATAVDDGPRVQASSCLCDDEPLGNGPGSRTVLVMSSRPSFHVGCQNASGLAMNELRDGWQAPPLLKATADDSSHGSLPESI